jgi:hypothetical protein
MRFSNDTKRLLAIWLEPWGEDYWIHPGETFEFAPEKPEDTFYFGVVHCGDEVSVYAEGGCEHVRVEHDGQILECGHRRPTQK